MGLDLADGQTTTGDSSTSMEGQDRRASLEGLIKASNMSHDIDHSLLIHPSARKEHLDPASEDGKPREGQDVDLGPSIAGEGGAASPPPSPKITKPTKRSTVVELREALSSLGLDIVGKKESLYKFATFIRISIKEF